MKQRTVSASASPMLSIAQCLVAQVDYNSMISSEKGMEIVEEGFVDSGVGGKFIDQNYVQTKGFRKERLSEPIKVYNVDGTPNKQGTIRYYVNLNIEMHG